MDSEAPASKKHVVLYLLYPSAAHEFMVRNAFRVAPPVLDQVFPFVTPSMDEIEIADALERLPDLGSDSAAIVQPPEHQLPQLQRDEVFQIVREQPDWSEMLESFGVQSPFAVDAREFTRFWLVLVQAVGQGIPPGMGYVVDKFSRRAFARRYIDVGGKLEVFATP